MQIGDLLAMCLGTLNVFALLVLFLVFLKLRSSACKGISVVELSNFLAIKIDAIVLRSSSVIRLRRVILSLKGKYRG